MTRPTMPGAILMASGCPRVIACTWRADAADHAAALAGRARRLVIDHHHPDEPCPVQTATSKQKGIDVVTAHERDPAALRRGGEKAIAAITARQLYRAPLLTRRYRRDQLGAAPDATRDKPRGFVKALELEEPQP